MTRFVNAISAAGGTMARKGLRARATRAWEENPAAHTPVSAASINGGSGRAGADCTFAVRPTAPKATLMARSVAAVGKLNRVVSGNTMSAATTTNAAPLMTAARM